MLPFGTLKLTSRSTTWSSKAKDTLSNTTAISDIIDSVGRVFRPAASAHEIRRVECRLMRGALPLIVLVLIGVDLSAQWVKYPTPGTPRTRDGKADLAAPTPRASN